MEIVIKICECCKRQFRSDVTYNRFESPSKVDITFSHLATENIKHRYGGELCGICATQLLEALHKSLLKEVHAIKKNQKWKDLISAENYQHIVLKDKEKGES